MLKWTRQCKVKFMLKFWLINVYFYVHPKASTLNVMLKWTRQCKVKFMLKWTRQCKVKFMLKWTRQCKVKFILKWTRQCKVKFMLRWTRQCKVKFMLRWTRQCKVNFMLKWTWHCKVKCFFDFILLNTYLFSLVWKQSIRQTKPPSRLSKSAWNGFKNLNHPFFWDTVFIYLYLSISKKDIYI